MSLREDEDEDRQKNCPSRGLGLGVAVAAIGVGVGAVLYYFMNRRPEYPNTAGSTSQDWTSEPEHNLHETEDTQEADHLFSTMSDSLPDLYTQETDNSFTTISEHSTTDTSINSSTSRCNYSSDQLLSYSDWSVTDSSDSGSDSDDSEWSSESSDSDSSEWDVTHSIEFPSYAPAQRTDFFKDYAWNLVLINSKKRNNNLYQHKAEAFRKRTWTLEECSICFEVILQDQEVMSLPCTHHFHTKCILPWLQEQQTCPNCRKAVD